MVNWDLCYTKRKGEIFGMDGRPDKWSYITITSKTRKDVRRKIGHFQGSRKQICAFWSPGLSLPKPGILARDFPNWTDFRTQHIILMTNPFTLLQLPLYLSNNSLSPFCQKTRRITTTCTTQIHLLPLATIYSSYPISSSLAQVRCKLSFLPLR
jgi:hypothetical protein